MSSTKFNANTGRDGQGVCIAGDGTRIDLDEIVNIERPKPDYDTIDYTTLKGNHVHADLPKAYKGGFEIVRTTSQIDDMFKKIDKDWKTSGTFEFGTFYLYITNRDGTVTTDKYSGVSFTLDDAGSFSENKEVRLKVSFTAASWD